MDFEGSSLVINLQKKASKKIFEIKCQSTDSPNELVISACIISAWDQTTESMQNKQIGRKWIINKNTRYEFVNFTINVHLDDNQYTNFNFYITSIYIQTECYKQIFEIKPSKYREFGMDINSVDQANFSQYGFKNSSIPKEICLAKEKIDIFQKKAFWITTSLLLLLVIVIVTIKLDVFKKIINYQSARERGIANSRGYF
ncbi:hypothetical protein RF11_00781 [Thelohanellus kitauei]|uniref:Transmembrane protein n=1 Tax=Thelohanellus kitauei TaxID=669202 RepID=A0A0C2NDE8_THEKT|nr:hypothetical protein RF11_00781 [Thelohanellus kitauei]